jgi:hypothetical protein
MQDLIGTELEIGDWVAYFSGLKGSKWLYVGQIQEITGNGGAIILSPSGNLLTLRYSNHVCRIEPERMLLYKLRQD